MGENGLFNLHDGCKLILRIGMEGGDIDQIIKRTPRRGQRRFQVIERKLHLSGKVRLRRAIGAAAHLAGHKQ